jgi:hypothetical protein
MSQFYFDEIILGDSLAGQVAGTLLARGGHRVLSLGAPAEPADPGWFFSSLLLERLLEKLDGRQVLSRPQRFQFLGEDIRLEFNGATPWPEELRREFPRGSEIVENLLREFETLGEKLSDLLWESHGWPLAGTAARWRFELQCMRHGLGWSISRRALAGRLQKLGAGPARTLLSALFSGLALLPLTHVSVAEAALVWHGAMRPQGASRLALTELLRRRFTQFHGEVEDLARLERIDTDSGSGIRLLLKGGRTVVAGRLLVASAESARPFSPPLPPCFDPVPTAHLRWTARNGKISPLLTDHLILGDSPPLRLHLMVQSGSCEAEMEWFLPTDQAELEDRLRALTPFASWETKSQGVAPGFDPPPLKIGPRRVFLDRRVARCGPGVFPALGGSGEILTGFSLAEGLLHSSGNT